MSDVTDISRIYIPKPLQGRFANLVRRFREGGAAALPAEYRAHVATAFTAGASIEAGLLSVMILRLESEFASEPSAAGEDEAKTDDRAAREGGGES